MQASSSLTAFYRLHRLIAITFGFHEKDRPLLGAAKLLDRLRFSRGG